jgi:hypothetical protein
MSLGAEWPWNNPSEDSSESESKTNTTTGMTMLRFKLKIQSLKKIGVISRAL